MILTSLPLADKPRADLQRLTPLERSKSIDDVSRRA
jgi:hypothetical protein